MFINSRLELDRIVVCNYLLSNLIAEIFIHRLFKILNSIENNEISLDLKASQKQNM